MLRFVTALEPEARPLVERYRLRRDIDAGAFRLFRRDDVALVVSGPGKTAAAAAVAYLHLAAGGVRQAVWLNVGIAGHGARAVGEAVLAHKITDRSSGESWYPPHVFEPAVATDPVVTVDRVERRFEHPVAYEMEASGFYPTACRFTTAELVQCLKVVSDGPGDVPLGRTRGEAGHVARLIGERIESIVELADTLLGLAGEVRHLAEPPPELAEMTGRWRFTVTEQRQLRRLLERWHALRPGCPLPGELAELARGKDVLHRLRGVLDRLPVVVGDGL